MLNFSVKRRIYGTLSSLTKLSRENNVGGLMINWVWVYIFHKFPTFIFADKSTIINMKCSCNVRIDNSERVLNSTEKPCPIQTWVCTNIYKIDRWSLLKVLQKCEKKLRSKSKSIGGIFVRSKLFKEATVFWQISQTSPLKLKIQYFIYDSDTSQTWWFCSKVKMYLK